MDIAEARRHYRSFEHTADQGIEAWGESGAQVHEALLLALSDTICDAAEGLRADEERLLSLSEDDPLLLLQRLLQELVAIFDTEGFLCAEAQVELGAGSLVARLRGERFDPERHGRGREVKAVTHHGLELRRDGEGWRGRVVVDI